MIAVQFAIAYRAQEPAAAVAGQDGFSAVMIKASGFTLHQLEFTGLGWSILSKQSGEYLDLQRGLTCRTFGEAESIKAIIGQGRLALRTLRRERGHRLSHNDSGVANAIV